MSELRLVPPCPGAPVSGNFGQVAGYGYPHRGMDFSVPVGTPVVAPCDGVVVDPTNDGSFGTAICIWHRSSGLYVLMAHLSRSDVYPGQELTQEQPVGASGNTGTSTGPHLHLQVCLNSQFPVDISQSRDPLAYWHPEDMMSPEERRMLYQMAQILTGVPVEEPAMLAAAIAQQYAQLSAGSSLVLGYRTLWNNLARHLNAPGVAGADGLHPGAYVWQEY